MNSQNASHSRDIAIIGMAGKFGDSNTVDELWEHLKQGDYLIKDIPLERWDYRPYYGHDKSKGDKIFCKAGSFIEGVDLFDPFFFNISEREAESLDPQLRLFMQVVWEAAEDAGVVQSIRGSSAGLFVANCFSDYYDVARQQQNLDYKYIGLGNAKWFLANRLCYFLDIHGPSMTIDTACSSSLVALDLACQALKDGRCETAIVGGVNLSLHPSKYQIFCGLNALSKTGNSYPFDEKADGYVPGEAIAVLLLKPLDNAIKDNDQIHGVIKGSFVNSAGKSLGPIYPNQELETEVIIHTWQKAGIRPEQITYFEAHGTGTKVGDPLEFNAIKSAFLRFTDKRQFCALGTIKGNIGHTEAASGIAGVIKVLLQMKYHTIPILPNLNTINPMIDIDDSPLYFNQENIPWERKDETTRIGVVSSYGIATYAHIVIEDFLPQELHRSAIAVTEQKPFIILLSAKEKARLKEQVLQLLVFIQENKFSDASLPDMAYTLQVGREPMAERLAIVVESVSELVEKLKDFIKNREDITGLYRGRTQASRHHSLAIISTDDDMAVAVDAWIRKGKIDQLLTLWVDGLDFDWNILYGDPKPHRISLPTYPFAQKRYWVSKNNLRTEAVNIPRHDMIPVIHPFVHENISDFSEQRFRSTFSGREFFLSDHVSKGGRLFPNVVYLEMARAAVEQSSAPLNAGSNGILLKNVVCAQPIAIRDQQLEIHIRLFPEQRGDIFFEVYSETENEGCESVVHCQGQAILSPVAENLTVDLEALQAQCTQSPLGTRQFYEVLSSKGFTHDGSRQGIEKLHMGSGQVLAELTLPSPVSDTQNQFILHPLIMDSALHASIGLMMSADDKILAVNRAYGSLNMPFTLGKLSVLGPCTSKMWAFIRFSIGDEAEAMPPEIDIDICNDAGLICIRMIGLAFPDISDSTEIQRFPQSAGKQETVFSYPPNRSNRGLLKSCPSDKYLSIQPTAQNDPSPTVSPSKVSSSQPAGNKKSKPVSNVQTTLSAEKLQQELATSLLEALDINESKIDFDVKFHDMGFDSIVVLEWIKAMNHRYGTVIAPTKIYEYPSIREFAVFLENELKKAVSQIPRNPETPDLDKTEIQIQANPDNLAPSRSLPDQRTQPFVTALTKLSRHRQPPIHSSYRLPGRTRLSRSNEQIAIIGISGRYPDAPNMDQYWRNLVRAKNSIRVIPKSRWDVDRYYDPRPFEKGKVNCKWLGLLDEIDCFDPLFFNISPSEAELMDPQHRLILQESYKAFEDCGYSSRMLSNKKCGVYLGMIHSEYGMLLHQNHAEGIKITGDSFAIAAGRISYHLNLTGPAITVDTACSSSLVATHLACQALLNHEIEIALVGGVCLFLTPECYISMCEAGMLSPQGRCKSFDNNADGFVPGEGAGAIVLKRLNDAESDNDLIYGVIIGSGVNQDGKTNGITAPSVKSQTNLVREVYDRYDIDPQHIDYIEMHGTGTKLGDPMELEALSTAFGERTNRKNYCAIASVKSNIGHTCAASGVASIQKVLLSLKHRHLVPTINFEKPNENFKLEESPFYVNTALKPWVTANGHPRRAAINSFGFSGTNAHVVIEEYSTKSAIVNHPNAARPNTPILFVLSATSKKQLKLYANLIKEFIEAEENLNISELAYTLQAGRDAMDYRVAFQADSKKSLAAKLDTFVSDASAKDIFTSWNNKKEDRQSVVDVRNDLQSLLANWFREGKLHKIAALWVKGTDIDWPGLYDGNTPHRISLPTYPFAQERYWIPQTNENRIYYPKQVFHPLLHENTSNLSTQRYRTIFSGSEFFFSDHEVQGHRVLPAVAYLEMAHTAIKQATEHLQDSQTRIRLKNIFWAKPMFCDGDSLKTEIVLHSEKNSEIFFEIRSQLQRGKSGPITHSQGQAALFPADDTSDLDIQDLLSHDGLRSIPPDLCYEAFQRMGIEYGPGHRAIDRVYMGSNYVLAKLTLPASVSDTRHQFFLHPSIMDSALQASICLAMEVENATDCMPLTPALPFALDELEVFDKCGSTMWAFIRYCQGAKTSHAVSKLDIDLCDDQGIVCVRMKGFSSRVLESNSKITNLATSSFSGTSLGSQVGTIRMLPVWEAVSWPNEKNIPARTDKILIVGGTSEIRDSFYLQNFQGSVLTINDDDTIEAITKKLERYAPIDHILWIASYRTLSSLFEDALIFDQNRGVLQVFRMIKALLNLGYDANALSLTFITIQALPVDKNESVNPTHATIHGMAGSLAKEYPNWKIRAIDLEKNCDWVKANIMSVPHDPLGRTYAYRSGEWYKQTLIPLQSFSPSVKPRYKTGGVYVVIGGAGGIGEVWSEYMIRNYNSRIIWIGKRQKDAAIQSKLDRLGAIGTQPLYISADATKREALQQAYHSIKEHYPHIDGLVHSAIVLLDKSIAKMQEDHFISGMAAKVDISVRMAQVFQQEPIDFLLFFSSIISFYRTPGQSNYASGSTFEDAFAYELGRCLPFSTKIINWAYWGSVGVVATEAYQRRMAKAGMDSIEPPEAMETLEFLLAGPFDQIALTKTTKPLNTDEHRPDEFIDIYPENLSSIIEKIQSQNGENDKKISERMAGIQQHIHEIDEFLLQLLWCQLKTMGLFTQKESPISELSAKSGILDIYQGWLEESFRVCSAPNYIHWDGSKYDVCNAQPCVQDTLWKNWNIKKEKWISDSGFESRVLLAETVLHALPDILTGKVLATDILFPDTSMDLVEGIYKKDTVSRYFNDVLAETVRSYIEERISQDPASRIRILEIGAGTGGTSAAIFQKLNPYRKHIHEYCYTDISKSFLSHAEAVYGQENPYLTYNLFNADLPVSDQGIQAGAYDLVIASNALHATRNIRKTLRNAKAALKNNGLILLIELSRSLLFTHMTFGLLKGWWLYQDPSIRIPGCPALYPETWKRLLREEGFRSVSFLAQNCHSLGLQAIIAESDGIVRQKRLPPAITETTNTETTNQTAKSEDSIDYSSEESLVPSEKDMIPDDLLREKCTTYFKKALGKTLKLQSHKIDTSVPLEKYGMDSIMVVQMVNQLSRIFHNVNSTLFFEYQTIEDLVEYFIKTQKNSLITLFESGNHKPDRNRSDNDKTVTITSRPPAISASEKAFHSRHKFVSNMDRAETQLNGKHEIAIIGLSGRYPQARNIDELWKNLTEGRNCITEIPKERWNWEDYFSKEKGIRDTIYTKWGGFIEDIDRFDAYFFQISPREAKQMDPQERLFLEEVYTCIEDAGYTPENLSTSGNVGVFVGVMNGNYPTGSAYWSIANRVSFLYNFNGPSMSVDTACSSSLTAIHLAIESLRSGTSECAIAGGVNLIVDPIHYLKLSAATMLSPGHQCRSFGDQADGFVDGEGVGAIVLKPLHKAIASNDHIYGIIKGSMLNAGGRTNGYTVPNPSAQYHLIFEALKRANVDARAISYLEAHGTGTSLGDPLEISGLNKAFQEFTNDKQFCSIGSIKSNIGHCESASGIAGLTKVLLQIKHGQLVPSLHSRKLNPNIDFSDTPFVVQHELEEWNRPVVKRNGESILHPRISGISSFGAGGANAHLIIEEYIPEKTNQTESGMLPSNRVIIVLSAKNEERLKARAEQLLTVIQDGLFIENHLIQDIAFTLQVGREAMEVRLALIVTNFKELEKKLNQFLKDQNNIDDSFFGRTNDNMDALSIFGSDDDLQGAIDAWISKRKYAKLLKLWVKGLNIDWNKFYPQTQFRRISLPTYPFAGERYWTDTSGEKTFDRKKERSLKSESFHPPAHQNPADSNNSKPGPNFNNKRNFQPETGHATTKDTIPAKPKPQGITLPPLSEEHMVIGKPESRDDNLKTVAASLSIDSCINDKVTSEHDVAEIISLKKLEKSLARSLADYLYMKPNDVELDQKLVDMGLDSVIGVEWIYSINKQYGTSIVATKVYDYPTIREFAKYLSQEMSLNYANLKRPAAGPIQNHKEENLSEPVSLEPISDADAKNENYENAYSKNKKSNSEKEIVTLTGCSQTYDRREAIAIVGMSGRYPDANNLEQYWDNLRHARNSIREIPSSRWDPNLYFDPHLSRPGKINCKSIGLLKNADCFDPLFFSISPAEAKVMDPQQRIFLEEGYKAFEDAGYNLSTLSNKKCGVYLGIMSNEYSLILHANSLGFTNTTGNSFAIAAARISYFLNLKGPAIPIDTGCSSSLVGTHLACQALLNREIEMALVGGVSLYFMPESYIGMCADGMLSPEGQCRAFDNDANGFVPGEGVGALVLKRFDDAKADNDSIYGLIIASGINQDGKTNGITAPSISSQIELERDIYTKHRIDPMSISYVEMHGTGTKLGDPIELEALSTVFQEKTDRRNYCAIGSVKSNIGHTSAAAGVAAIQKVLLCLKHKQLVPTLNFKKPNEHFNFEKSPFYVNTELRPWRVPEKMLRRAAVSSFGFSGTNAHIVIEEYSSNNVRNECVNVPMESPLLFLLSARNMKCLKKYAEKLKCFLAAHEDLNILDISFTLQVGRSSLDQRLAVFAESKDALLKSLNGFIDEKPNTGILTGDAKKEKSEIELYEIEKGAKDALNNWIRSKNFAKLAALWVKGLSIDWNRLYDDPKPIRISLPTYPFENKRYWLPDISQKNTKPESTFETKKLDHPFIDGIDKRMSFEEEGLVFVKKIYPDDAIVRDHKVNHQSIFPGSGYMEMVMAALREINDAKSITISRIVWEHPLQVMDSPRKIQVILKKHQGNFKYKVQTSDGHNSLIHSHGELYPHINSSEKNNQPINIEEFKSHCLRYIAAQSHYSHTADSGIFYGPYFKTLKGLWINEDEALGLLQLDPRYHDELDTFLLHPALADGALQTIVGITPSLNGNRRRVLIPFSIEKVEIFNSIDEKCFAYAKTIGKNRYDVAILDSEGHACVRFHNIMLRSIKDPFADFFFLPKWQPASIKQLKQDDVGVAEPLHHPQRNIVVFHTENGISLKNNILKLHSNDGVTQFLLSPTSNIDFLDTIPGSESLDAIYFLCIVYPHEIDKLNFDGLKSVIQNYHILFFRLIKTLINAGHVEKKMRLKVITNKVIEVRSGDSILPYTAGLHGLCKSLALEFKLLNVNCIDVSLDENTSVKELRKTAEMIVFDPNGQNDAVIAIRNCRKYFRRIYPMNLPSVNHSPLRQRGVYLIVGGVGGIGFELAQYLAKYVEARLILIGRSNLTDNAMRKIAKIKSAGGEVLYLQADVTNLDAMESAIKKCHLKFGSIHGVFHSAIVLHDNALRDMDEKSFNAAIGPKIYGSLVLNNVIGRENLDFLVYFSSILSFTGNYGQANYAAATTFQDDFGSYLSQNSHYPVIVINWGYWGSVGVVAHEKFRNRLLSKGVHSIEPDEGMQALHRILGHRLNQVIAFKAEADSLDSLDVEKSKQIDIYPFEINTHLSNKTDNSSSSVLNYNDLSQHRHLFYEIERFASKLLLAAFHKMGIFLDSKERHDKHSLLNILKIRSNYLMLIDSFLGILEKSGYIEIHDNLIVVSETSNSNSPENELQELVSEKAELLSNFPEMQPHLDYLWNCTYHLPDILRGNVSATEIIFTDSAYTLLDGIYKNNVFSDYFNTLIANTVYASISERLAQCKENQRINIIEIGAGTGATATAVFKSIENFSDKIAYWFTDISNEFIIYGKNQFSSLYPFFKSQKLDIENSVSKQGFTKGFYDIVIASNVVHATRNLRTTLYNIKSLLKTGGILVLSEAAGPTNFTTTTFGLLDGWWLFEDALDRLPGSPLLDSGLWVNILKETGFKQINILNKSKAKDNFFPQHVFSVKSDGIVINQEKITEKEHPFLSIQKNKSRNNDIRQDEINNDCTTTKSLPFDNTADLQQYIEDAVVERITLILQIDKNEIDTITPFSEFGVDSISAIKIINDINEYLKIDLEPTDLFNYSTISNLCNYIFNNFQHSLKVASSLKTHANSGHFLSEIDEPGDLALKENIENKNFHTSEDRTLMGILKSLEAGNADADEMYRFFQGDI